MDRFEKFKIWLGLSPRKSTEVKLHRFTTQMPSGKKERKTKVHFGYSSKNGQASVQFVIEGDSELVTKIVDHLHKL